jgi:hypothetical protein
MAAPISATTVRVYCIGEDFARRGSHYVLTFCYTLRFSVLYRGCR